MDPRSVRRLGLPCIIDENKTTIKNHFTGVDIGVDNRFTSQERFLSKLADFWSAVLNQITWGEVSDLVCTMGEQIIGAKLKWIAEQKCIGSLQAHTNGRLIRKSFFTGSKVIRYCIKGVLTSKLKLIICNLVKGGALKSLRLHSSHTYRTTVAARSVYRAI